MKHKKSPPPTLNAAELQLIEQLRKYPELFERIRSILEISASTEGPLKKADEIEALLIEEMRRLGHATMETWAGRAEQTLADELKQKDSSASVRKKKR
jgi:2-iminoacetate synthase ThiH